MGLHWCHFLLRSRQRVLFACLLGVIFLAGTYNLIGYEDERSLRQNRINGSGVGAGPVAASIIKVDAAARQKYAVDTSTCKIPEMNPMDESIQGFLKPDFGYPVDCRGQHRSWAYVNGTRLVLNETAVHESGYSTGALNCCYRIIERDEQPLNDYDINADNYIKYSDKCHPISKGGSKIDAEFIRVHCISRAIPLWNDVVYRDFFAMAQPGNDRLLSTKLASWDRKARKKDKAKSDYRPPPNVILIGIDNNSRMNSHRNLRRTLEVLRRIGAVELMGYTKVGENTFPNTIPFLAGISVKELKEICYSSPSDPHDDCPYVWKVFDKMDYVTVNAEDSPYLGGFNYLKTGFLRKPTDFYLRPLMLAVMTHLPRFDYYHTDCIGRYMTDEFVFDYMLNVLNLTTSRHALVFIHSWLTSLAHHSYNNLQFGDTSISNFIQKLISVSNDNTIFFFMSDHGQRYGPIRETVQGWYEDKLPTQWVYLPQHLRDTSPEWYSSLKVNSKRLTSHFDVYKTLLHISHQLDEDRQAEESYSDAVTKKLTGRSLFEMVPENRTCEDAGITVNFCACSKPEPISVEDKRVQEAAKAAVNHLANLVPLEVCAEPTLQRIVTAGYLSILARPVYVITLITDPGDFLFEVNVEVEKVEESRHSSQERFVISTDLLRMNKISRAANCVRTPLLERYCYSK